MKQNPAIGHVVPEPEKQLEEIDTLNAWGVSMRGALDSPEILILGPPRGPMSKEKALVLAAWIVTLAFDDELWARTLNAVRST